MALALLCIGWLLERFWCESIVVVESGSFPQLGLIKKEKNTGKKSENLGAVTKQDNLWNLCTIQIQLFETTNNEMLVLLLLSLLLLLD